MAIKVYRLLALCVLVPQFGFGQSDINFDKLSDCAGLVKMRTMLDSPPSLDCRTARGALETKMMSQFDAAQEVCLMVSPPVPRLAGFSCIDSSYEGNRDLSCFRSVDKNLLRRYIKDYDVVYRARALRYLDDAGNCAAGNGSAAAVPESLFPAQFKVVARANFGFALGIRKERASKSRAYHGYADVDPDVETAFGAVEVFDIFNLQQAFTDEKTLAESGKELSVEIDDLSIIRECGCPLG